MRCFEEVLYDLMVLFQELLHFVDQIVRVFLGLAELVSHTIHLFIEALSDAIEVDVIALFILTYIYL